MTIRFKQIEYHQVHLHKEMAVDDNVIEENGMTTDQFKCMLMDVDVGETTYSDEEWDTFWEIVHGYSDVLDSEEDWFTDRKGGYDIEYELLEDEE